MVRTRYTNPFFIISDIPEAYFCDRKPETAELMGNIRNGRNTVLIAPRRIGKSGLIYHCFRQREICRDYKTFFVDIYATSSLQEFVFLLGKQIFDGLKGTGGKFLERFVSVVASLRTAVKFHPVTGAPSFDIGLGEIKQPETSLEEIFNYLETAPKPCVVAIDEFQQIAKYSEKNVEALLRSYIQKCRNTVFIFSGSQRHLIRQMFTSASKPFYSSAALLELDPIAPDEYEKFVRAHFSAAGKALEAGCFRRIYEMFEGRTWYIHFLLNKLYEVAEAGGTVRAEEADQVLHHLVDAQKASFQDVLEALPIKQKELLFAIAKAGKAREITSEDFITRHGLSSASSVQAAVKQLLAKDLVTKQGAVHEVEDRFLSLWISDRYGSGYIL